MIKKITALVLVLLMAFHFVAYRFVELCIEKNEQQNISQKIVNHLYNDSQLITIQVPLNLPYVNDKAPERYDGEICIDDKNYNYVEMQISNGYIFLKCLPNNTKSSVNKKKTDILSILNDIEKQTPSKKSTPQKTKISDYTNITVAIKCSTELIIQNMKVAYAAASSIFYNYNFHNNLEKPPQA